MRPHAEGRQDPLTVTEERLRAAFAARAALVTYRDLRHDEPPQGRSRGLRRVRGLAFASLGAVAAVAAAYLLVVLVPGSTVAPTPAPPARPPGISKSPVTPTPAVVAPSVAGPGAEPKPGAEAGPEAEPKPGAPSTPGRGPKPVGQP
ncbi:hypothetical protein OG462_18660 [Streptomyces sp. NBC_01077]|uniref:hypothetical protein n=1 Tax=Streptomyces sp. NBC_01077 TaxID=2903746 RepID=UPI0038703DEF|nr:hypothetical protein OG462_18660 [Streptomyces sp. NBC_01077]